jgi:flagellum-specific peptidoglycan hydrolase FlgJ
MFSDRARAPELHRLQRALRVPDSAAGRLAALLKGRESSAEAPREPWVIDQLHREAEERRIAAHRETERLRELKEQDAERARLRMDKLAKQDALRARREAERQQNEAARKRLLEAEAGRQRLARAAEAARLQALADAKAKGTRVEEHARTTPEQTLSAAPSTSTDEGTRPASLPAAPAAEPPREASASAADLQPVAAGEPKATPAAKPALRKPDAAAAPVAPAPKAAAKPEPIQIAETTISVAPPPKEAPTPVVPAAPEPSVAPEPRVVTAPPPAPPAVSLPKPPKPKPARNVDRPRRPTPMSAEEATKTLALAFERATGEEATKEVVSVLWGQWALETGRGRWMVDYNYAGLKGRAPDGGSAPWSTWEETDDGPRRVRSRFRAYESADHGAYDYVKLLSRRYPSAFAAARRGDANTFIDQLDKGGFFTERPEHYTRSVISLAREFLRKHAKLLEMRETRAD